MRASHERQTRSTAPPLRAGGKAVTRSAPAAAFASLPDGDRSKKRRRAEDEPTTPSVVEEEHAPQDGPPVTTMVVAPSQDGPTLWNEALEIDANSVKALYPKRSSGK